MAKNALKSPTLQRLEEVLIELEINYKISKEGSITLTNEDIILDEPNNLAKYLDKIGKKSLLGIYENGEIHDLYDNLWFFKLCNNCGKFFLGPGKKDAPNECIYCKSSSLKFLEENKKIPNWNSIPKIYVLNPDYKLSEIESLEESQQNKIENIAKTLSHEAKYITVTEEKKAQLINLIKCYPNMAEFHNYQMEQISLSSMRLHKEYNFKACLLLGNAGCGKTSYVVAFSSILQGKPAIRIDLGNSVPTFTCVGSDPGYKNAKHGLILSSMFPIDDDFPIKNPIVHFDELDKINQNENYSIETIFYSILEKSTSKAFIDNFFGLEVDASEINYIFTANSIDTIPKPILNRLRVFEIPDYTEEQLLEVVIDNFYQNWLKNNKLKKEFFPEVLSDEIKNTVLQYSKGDPRSINDAFTRIFAETMRIDDKTGTKIAMFSHSELCGGWEHFRGKSDYPRGKWTLPAGFKNNFDPVEFLESFM